MVRKGMDRMGGRCGVESRPGEGSEFWVEFPIAEERTSPHETHDA
jgi:signal transduction histidine kinase